MQDASAVKTRKLYDEDGYAREFEAEIVSLNGNDLVLDRTMFFPEEGGQSPDQGLIGGIRVLDVQIRDEEIHHFLEEKPAGYPFAAGDTVHGEIDWALRFSNMQQHSGEHLVSGTIHNRYGFDNVGFHLSASEVTLDFNGIVPDEDLPEIENYVNQKVWENFETRISFTTPEEREHMEYRSKLPLPGMVRIVEFPGVDACACCAPHVKRTGEIGLIKITGMMRLREGVRINILCGDRALALIQRDADIVTKTANYLTTSPENIYPQTLRDKDEIRGLKSRLKDMAARLMDQEVASIPAEKENVLLFIDGVDMQAVRHAVNTLMEKHEGFSGAFAGNDETGYQFVIGSPKQDCRALAALLRENFGAKGGGRPEMVQGSCSAKEAEIRKVLPA